MIRSVTVAGVLMLALCTAGHAQVLSADAAAKMHGDLYRVLTEADETALVPVKAIMRDQVSRDRIEEARWGNADRNVRRQVVADMLKANAARSQADILNYLRDAEAAGDAARIRTLWLTSVVAADVTPAVAAALAARADVALLAHNPMIDVYDDPEAEQGGDVAEVECGVSLMAAPRVWNELGITGRGALIANIDSGTCREHPDLSNQIWTNPGEIPNNNIDDDNNGFIDDTYGWNFHENNNNPTDFHGHGTHTGGTIAGDGAGGTETGMAPDCDLMVCRVSGSFSDEVMVWNAMQYAADNGAHAWNMSLGWPHNRNPVRATWRDNCLNAMSMGTAPVIAAGNEGTCCPPFDHVRTPGDVPEVITVGATDCNDVIANFSSRGPVTWQSVPPYNDWPYPPGMIKPDVSAPGVNTTSSRNCSGYTQMSGTSMATPHVTGAVALMIENNPNLDPEQIKQCLMDTAVDLGEPGLDNVYGAGRVNAYEAVVACSGSPEPAACCFADGGCDDLMRTDCVDEGGRWNFGKECGTFDCPQPGACCITNSECEITLERDCLQRGGEFMGEGLGCELICACDVIKKMKGKCKGSGTIKAIVKFKNASWDGRTVQMGVGERLKFDVAVHGKKATLYTCCFNGPQTVSLIEPDGCLEPIIVDCP